MTDYQGLIAVIDENPSGLERWLVFGDKLMEDGNAHGEAIAGDIYLRRGMIAGEQAQEARELLLNERKRVWKEYAQDTTIPSSYFLENDDLWVGAFPLQFPNGNKHLDKLDGAFVTEEFPDYRLMPQTGTYASSVHQLRRYCEAEENSAQPTFPRGNDSTMYRPLTFRENILARVEDFYMLYDQNRNKRTLDQRLRLFNTWLDSCTGIAYKVDSSEFKLILLSPHLIGINEDFNEEAITEELTGRMLDYDALQGDGVITLNRNYGIYNQLLTQEQVLNHSAWNTAVEDDNTLLKEHTGIVFSQREGKNMSFLLRDETNEDQLRFLYVNDLNSNSNAGSSVNLNNFGCFLRR